MQASDPSLSGGHSQSRRASSPDTGHLGGPQDQSFRTVEVDSILSQTPDCSARDSQVTAPLSVTGAQDPASFISPPPTTTSRPGPASSRVSRRTRPRYARLGTEVQNERAKMIRTPASSATLLSSPPPSAQTSLLHGPERTPTISYTPPTSEQLNDASATELRSFLDRSMSEVQRLATLLREAHATTAHHRLQHKFFRIEAEDTIKRIDVEYQMLRREMEVLATKQHRHRNGLLPPGSERGPGRLYEPNMPSRIDLEVQQQHQSLRSENEVLKRRLRRAKKLIRYRDGEVISLLREGSRLRTRIRDNREHFERLYALGAWNHLATPRQSKPQATMTPNTASKQAGNPRASYLAGPRNERQDTFAALLLADQVLSQENPSTQSTPARSRQHRQAHLGHSRGTQSLSSLPSTPIQLLPPGSKGTGLSSPARVRDPSAQDPHQNSSYQRTHHRRESRDSTISASDAEVDAPRDDPRDRKRGDVVHESQASQLATHLLRRSPVLSREGRDNSTEKTKRTTQTKLLGQAIKASLDGRSNEAVDKKRGFEAVEHQGLAQEGKRSRRSNVSREIGLGIDGLERARA